MDKLLEKLAEHSGHAAPFMYAAVAYYFFRWLDENASDEAKAALARTMKLKTYKSEQVASALVEIFDRIYTYPLWSRRAFLRSLLFTTVVSAIFVYELGYEESLGFNLLVLFVWLPAWLFNVLSDYLSLIAIRQFLVGSGTHPVLHLILGTWTGVAIVIAANVLRLMLLYVFLWIVPGLDRVPGLDSVILPLALAALAVFVWLPLVALGILTARFLTPLSWVVGRTQWFLKEGMEHPLKAIGYVAAVVVFLGTVAVRVIFSA